MSDDAPNEPSPFTLNLSGDFIHLRSLLSQGQVSLFKGGSVFAATELMLMVHHKGKAIVWSGEQEKAEFFVQQLQSHQLLATMQKV